MARTSISWATHVWNPVIGCSKVSPGCRHCYAEKFAWRLARMGKEGYAEVADEHGYDGLYTDDCCCEIDDLMPCFEPGFSCRAGYKHACTDPECDFADEPHWHIGPEKEEA